MMRFTVILGLAGVLACSGCSTPTDPNVAIAAGQYPDAFEATRESLRELNLTLDRVDAASGVITTAMKPSSGFATPWDLEQSGADQEWEDFINRQRRFVRVEFVPAGEETPVARRDPAAAKAAPSVDLRDYAGPVVATVSVTVERVQRPGWRVNTKSINQSTFTRDPELAAAGKFPTYTVELEPDRRLAGRIARDIQRKLENRPSDAEPGPATEAPAPSEPQSAQPAPADPGATGRSADESAPAGNG